jgi:hypothetical protein
MDIEARITRLEDIESIRQLKARYCEICDDNHNTAEIVNIFTADGIWEGAGIGRAQGHEEIQALFQSFQKSISFSQHMVQNPIIEVNGETASARWYFFGMFTYYTKAQKRWQAARYHEDYQKINGEWKIKHLKIAEPVVSARYETGWRNGT